MHDRHITSLKSHTPQAQGLQPLGLAQLVASLACLAFCSCRTTEPGGVSIIPAAHFGKTGVVYAGDKHFVAADGPAAGFSSLPLEAYTGHPADGYTRPGIVPPFMQQAAEGGGEAIVSDEGGVPDPTVLVGSQRMPLVCSSDQMPMPMNNMGPWKPPGIGCPWPEDEYIFDGGDQDGSVKVRPDWQLVGLDSEDTIAHYDTLDGRTVVKPTNRVCIYAPRFAAVRQVTLPYGDNQLVKAGGVDMPIGPARQDKVQPVTTAIQPIQPVGELGHRGPVTFLERTPPVGLIAETVIRATVDRLKPYENFDLVRYGIAQENEKPFLAIAVQSAIVWTLDQGVQVEIGGVKAVVLEGDKRAQATYGLEPGSPCLRVCKLASTSSAKPGEIVEFTIRFDNVGEQPVGNVTIVDDLTTRLELVPGTGQCSRNAKFMTEPNKEGSLILRWEIDEPLNPGQGGIARFKCKVR
jgi:uncharacterized repeat protein (TIGR01451 family)